MADPTSLFYTNLATIQYTPAPVTISSIASNPLKATMITQNCQFTSSVDGSTPSNVVSPTGFDYLYFSEIF
jgi:hypothetical protein